MGVYDREYYREQSGNPFVSRLQGGSVVLWLLGINFAVFLLDSVLTGSKRGSGLSPQWWGNFNIEQGIFGLQIWRLFTYQFLHDGILHLLFNMMVIYFFGPLMEKWWGSRRFLAFYLLCGASGAVVYTLLALVPELLPGVGLMVGASGCAFGILVGCAVLYPHQRVMLLIPPIPLSMRTLALLFLGIATLSLLAGARNAGGEAAHLGGAALGFLLIKYPHWLSFSSRMSLSRLHAAQENRERRSDERQMRRTEQLDKEVDRILSKVKEQGIHSLSAAEKRILQRATNHQRRVG